MNRTLLYALTAIFLSSLHASAKVAVVTSAPNLADIARQVGGNAVSVTSLARPSEDLHFVEPRPSFVAKLRGADMVVIYGMDFDIWMRPLIDNARNKKIARGGPGYVDASVGIPKLEVAKGRVDMAMGEVHPAGNPHYILDPQNAKTVAKNILGGLIRVSPENEEAFRANYTRYIGTLDSSIAGWKKLMDQHRGQPIVAYHRSWVYFLKRFGLKEAGTVEPKPGIPPSPSHISKLIGSMKQAKVKVLMMETFYPRRFPDLICKQTGASLLVLPYEAGAMKGTDSYIAMIDHIVHRVSESLK